MTTGFQDSTPPQPGPRKPRRAWWLVGSVVLVVGIVVALIVGNRGTPALESAETSPAPSTTPITGDIRYSGTVVLPAAAGSVDFDATPPQVGSNVGRTDIDVQATGGYSSLEIGNEDLAMTSMVGADPNPGPDDCVAQIQQEGTRQSTVTVGSRFCMQTTEGRIALFRVSTAPSDGKGPVQLAVTVWELPT